MNGVVSSLYDIDSIVIPEELMTVSVDENNIAAEISALALRYAKETWTEQAEKGDLVYCSADKAGYPDGRTILIYTGMSVPGAEQAAGAVLGGKIGDTVKTELVGRAVELTIMKILHRTPVEVNDALVAGMGIEGVTTLDEYRKYVSDKIKKDASLENEKAIVRYYIDQMVENSTFIYDENEMEAYICAMADKYKEDYEAEGEPFDPEEVKEGIKAQEKQTWMAEAFCKSKGIVIDKADIEQEADNMLEMMELSGEECPDRSEVLKMMTEDAYYDGLFSYINRLIEEKVK